MSISKQITKFQTNKKLVALIDRLVLAPLENFASIHAQGGKGNYPSRIGITLLDYSSGTGDSTVSLNANVSPSEIAYIFKQIELGKEDVSFSQNKIVAARVGTDGRAPVTNLEIIRASKDKTGAVRRYPWYIKLTNGTGIPDFTTTGGTMCKSGSFKKDKEAYINLGDIDMFNILYETTRYIGLWELTNGLPQIKQAQKQIIEEALEAKSVKH